MKTNRLTPWLWSILIYLLLGSELLLAQPQNHSKGHATDRILIAFEQGTLHAEKKTLHARLGAAVLYTIPKLNVDVVQVPAGTVLEKIALYDKNPNVSYAEPDFYRLVWIPKEGSEPLLSINNMFDEQWALNNTGQKMVLCDPFWGCFPLDWAYIIGTPGADINAPQAWSIGRSHSSIKIAIMDSGIDYNSVDLKNKYIVTDSRNFVEEFESGEMDQNGHGTHVAGIAAAQCDNNQGIAGVACDASLVNLKVCYNYQNPNDPYDPLNGAGVCPASAVAQAIIYAADPNGDGDTSDRFDVINMSFATDTIIDGVWIDLQGRSVTEEAAINIAYDAGIVLIAAAGNDGTEDQRYPAAYDNVIAVGATDEDDFVTSFSNRGPDWVSIGAPGNHIWSTMPNTLCGLTSPPYTEACLWPLSGTSMASPHATGAAALVLGYLRDEYTAGRLDQPPTNAQVRCHLEQGADRMGVQGLDYSVSYFQYGRLSLTGAMQPIAVCDGTQSSSPIAPSGLTAANSYSGNGRNKTFNSVYLTWTNNANNATTNQLERCDNVSASGPKRNRVYSCAAKDWFTLSDSIDASQSTYFDSMPSTATNSTYLYRLRANNDTGFSTWSNEAGITTPSK